MILTSRNGVHRVLTVDNAVSKLGCVGAGVAIVGTVYSIYNIYTDEELTAFEKGVGITMTGISGGLSTAASLTSTIRYGAQVSKFFFGVTEQGTLIHDTHAAGGKLATYGFIALAVYEGILAGYYLWKGDDVRAAQCAQLAMGFAIDAYICSTGSVSFPREYSSL